MAIKSVTSYKNTFQISDTILIEEYHTIYLKGTVSGRPRQSFDKVEKGWKHVDDTRETHDINNGYEDWVYIRMYTRRQPKA